MKVLGGKYLFPINQKPIKDGYLKIAEDGTIVAIGKIDGCTDEIEYHDGALIPSFTNAHCHSELSHLKGKFYKGSGMSGFINQINSLRESAPREERIAATKQQFEKMYREGVSAIGDISNCDESFEIKMQSPIYTRTFLEVFGSDPKDAEKVLNTVTLLHQKALSMGLDAAPTPHSPYTMSPRLLQLSAAAALQSGYLSYHNQESEEEEQLLISGTGALADNYKGRGMHTPPITGKPALFYFLDILQKIHLAPFDENIILVHNTVTNEESIDKAISLLKKSYWVTCPLSNIFIHNTLAPLDLFRKKGLKIAIGTDSLSSNDTLSMIEEIKCINQHFPHIPLDEILRWACFNGAEAIGKERILGSFEVGKKPGVVLIDEMNWDTMQPTNKSTTTRLI